MCSCTGPLILQILISSCIVLGLFCSPYYCIQIPWHRVFFFYQVPLRTTIPGFSSWTGQVVNNQGYSPAPQERGSPIQSWVGLVKMRHDKSVNDSFDFFQQTWLHFRWKTFPLTSFEGFHSPAWEAMAMPQEISEWTGSILSFQWGIRGSADQ